MITALINTKFGKIVREKPKKVIENIDNALNKIPEPPKIELCNSLLDVLSTKIDDIMQNEYVNDKVQMKKILKI